MFGKFKVSKSLLDAVNSVIGTDSTQVQQLDEATSEKVPTSTGTKVYGHRYGDSKKARKDQTKSSVDDLKGPKDKEMKEELKGNQHKIDKNHNNKIDAQDFKILRGKKEVKESDDCVTKPEAKKIADQEVDNHEKGMHKGKKITVKEGSFSERLVAMYEAKSSGTEPTFTDNNIGEKIDTKVRTLDTLKGRVKAPASYDDSIEHKSSKVKLSAEEKEEGHEDEKADKALVKKLVKKTALKEDEVELEEATPAKNQDVADKAYLKHKPGTVKGQLTQIGRFLRGKPEIKEEVELNEDNLDSIAKKHGMEFKRTTYGAGMKHPKHGEISINRYGEWNHKGKTGDSTGNFASLDKHLSSLKEEVELNEDNLDSIAKKHGMEYKKTTYGAGMKHPKHGEISINRYGEWHHKGTNKTGDSEGNFASLDKHLSSLKEEVELDEQINEVLSKDASAGDWIHDFVHSDNPKFAGKSKAERKKMALGAYYGKKNEELESVEEKVIAGTPGWKEVPKEVKDKSGAVHSPMSRAKDLAKKAFKKVKNETMMGKISN
jgi:hypothetical protein